MSQLQQSRSSCPVPQIISTPIFESLEAHSNGRVRLSGCLGAGCGPLGTRTKPVVGRVEPHRTFPDLLGRGEWASRVVDVPMTLTF